MKKLLWCLSLGLLCSCIPEDRSTLPVKYGEYNAVNIVFVDKSDTSLIEVDDLGYTGFYSEETKKNTTVLKIDRQYLPLFFPFFKFTGASFMALPINPFKPTTTFVLKHPSGNDTVQLTAYKASQRYISDSKGYELDLSEPTLKKITFDTYTNYGFDSINNVLYITVFK